MARFKEWEAAGGLVIEESVVRPVPALPADEPRTDLRCAALPPLDRRGVAADVVLGPDPRRRDDAGEQRAGSHRAGRRGRRDPADDVGGRCGCAVADGGSADGREVRHAGARGAGDGRPVRRRPDRRAGGADSRARGVVAGRCAGRRAGGGDGADARHSPGPAGRRRDAAADRAEGPDAGDGLRIPLGRWRSAGGCAGDPAVARRRAAAGASAEGRPAGVLCRPVDG